LGERSGYATFDDFLAALAARKRKAIKRERREALPPASGALADRQRH
jgi:predicted N-acyltransferase